MEQRINSWLKNLTSVVQQKFDLSQATFPPFVVIAKWSAVAVGALVLSAAANVFFTKYVLFLSSSAVSWPKMNFLGQHW